MYILNLLILPNLVLIIIIIIIILMCLNNRI